MLIQRDYLNTPQSDLDRIIRTSGICWSNFEKKNILITGATGFIGKWILSVFLYANDIFSLDLKIFLLSRHPKRFEFKSNLDLNTNVEWIEGDVRTFNPPEDICFDFVIHGATDVLSESSSLDILDVCYLGTKNVLEKCVSKGVESKFLLLSSGAVYGNHYKGHVELSECENLAPSVDLESSSYGEGKRVSELLLHIYGSSNPLLKFNVARCFAFVGPHLAIDKHFAIGNFIGNAFREETIKINGDGSPLRTYMYAGDMACWLLTILESGLSGETFNVGGSRPISILKAAELVREVSGKTIDIFVTENLALGEPSSYIPSTNKINHCFDLPENRSLTESIKIHLDWLKSVYKESYETFN